MESKLQRSLAALANESNEYGRLGGELTNEALNQTHRIPKPNHNR